MSNLWDQLALTEPMSLQSHVDYLARREQLRLVQFLMALRDDFEGLQGNILHRTPHPPVDAIVSELLAEETRLKTQAGKGTIPIPRQSVLATLTQLPFTNQQRNTLKVGFDECSFYKKKGHWKAQCPKLFNKGGTVPPPPPH